MARKQPRAFKFAPFSKKQKKVVTWWREGSPYKDYDGIIADGSIRSGKTIAFIVGFIKWSTACFEDQNFIISGRTIGTLKRNVVGPMLRILRALKITYVYNRSENYLEFGGNTYYLFGADNEASQDVVQGITAAGWFADEAALHHPDFLNQALGRLLSVEGSKFWWNCNPESPAHTVKVDFIDKAKDKRILHLHFNLNDNLTLTERAKEKARRMFSGVFFKRYILGLWVVAEGLCFSAFDEDIHVVDTLPEMEEYWVSGDLGTTNPTVFLLIGKGVDDNYYVVDEWRWDSKQHGGKVKRNPELVDELLNWESFHGVYPQLHIFDPSAADFIAEAEEGGVYGVTDADNSVVPGIRWTDSLLHLRKMFIHRRCSGLIAEIIGYMWDPKAAAKGEDKPIKLNDHGCDAWRYFVMTVIANNAKLHTWS